MEECYLCKNQVNETEAKTVAMKMCCDTTNVTLCPECYEKVVANQSGSCGCGCNGDKCC